MFAEVLLIQNHLRLPPQNSNGPPKNNLGANLVVICPTIFVTARSGSDVVIIV